MGFGIKLTNKAAATAILAKYRALGTKNIGGLDEVGRGSLCGPVVAACVVLPTEHKIEGIKDSKKLSPNKREALSKEIIAQALGYGIGVCENEEVDAINNIPKATELACIRALRNYSGPQMGLLLCDGGLTLTEPGLQTKVFIKGDALFEVIAAASILAKVYRDRQMAMYHSMWPAYGFASNQGYGTLFHQEALKEHGLSPIHRKTFGICKRLWAEEKDAKKSGGGG